MSVCQRPAKRQCFSIESLAISSRVEKQDLSRDTDSPYLHYIHSKENELNNNSHLKELNYSVQQQFISLYRQCENGADLVINNPSQNVHFSAVSTSTPITLPTKRRRMCSSSSSTSPTTSDDERQFTDMSVTSESTEDEKLSISSSTTSSVTSDPDLDSCPEDSISKRKKARTAFTGEQLRELEKRYKVQKYLSASDRSQLARTLRLKDQQVKTWFQNRRMKEKRQQKEDEHCKGFNFPTGGVDIAHLAALGICPPPYVGNMLGTPSTYGTQTSKSIDNNEHSPQETLESPSPVHKVPSTNIMGISNALYMDRLAAIHRQSQLLPAQFAMSPSNASHPMMHYGLSVQFSPSIQIGKRS